MTLHRKAPDSGMLVIAACSAFALAVFLAVADEVREGDAGRFDYAMLRVLRIPAGAAGARDALAPEWVLAVARDITALGSIPVLGLIVAAVLLFLMLARRRRTALFVLVATTSGVVTMTALKAAFNRPRPHLFPHLDFVLWTSFPSGHAMISAVVYLTLGVLLARLMPSRALRLYVFGVVVVLTGLIGISRIYLGVHWPTDVIAGWAAGAAWALGCLGVVELVGTSGRQK